MKKSQLVDALAARFEGNRKLAADALDAVLDTITREVARGEKVAIKGFGTFEKVAKGAKGTKGFVPEFSAAKELTGVVSGKVKLPKLPTAPILDRVGPVADRVGAEVKGAASVVRKAPIRRTPATKTAPAKAVAAEKPAAPAASSTTKAPASKAATAKKSPAKSTAKKTTAAKTTAKKSPAPAKKATPARSGQTAAPQPSPEHVIKGNAQSKKYHLPGGRWYDNTVAEEWFASEADAIAAGYTKAGAPAKKA